MVLTLVVYILIESTQHIIISTDSLYKIIINVIFFFSLPFALQRLWNPDVLDSQHWATFPVLESYTLCLRLSHWTPIFCALCTSAELLNYLWIISALLLLLKKFKRHLLEHLPWACHSPRASFPSGLWDTAISAVNPPEGCRVMASRRAGVLSLL